jgi:hypothetical protein
LGLHADSSIRENARRERGLFLAGFQKRIWLSEKQLLNLRCHRITMVQGTESRKGLNLPFTRRANFCRPTCWRVLRESEMSPVLAPHELAYRIRAAVAKSDARALEGIRANAKGF